MKYWVLALAAFLLIGCSEKEKSDDEFATPDFLAQKREGKTKLIPFDINIEWVYEMHALDTSTHSMRIFKIDTFKVISDTMIGGTSWYEIDGLGQDKGFMSNQNEGLYFAQYGSEPFLWAKYPAELGDTFTVTMGTFEARNQLTAVDLETIVPAGIFYCHKYQQKIGPKGITTNFYFAPGVGLIKMEILNVSGTEPVAYSALKEIRHVQKKIE